VNLKADQAGALPKQAPVRVRLYLHGDPAAGPVPLEDSRGVRCRPSAGGAAVGGPSLGRLQRRHPRAGGPTGLPREGPRRVRQQRSAVSSADSSARQFSRVQQRTAEECVRSVQSVVGTARGTSRGAVPLARSILVVLKEMVLYTSSCCAARQGIVSRDGDGWCCARCWRASAKRSEFRMRVKGVTRRSVVTCRDAQ
jgi:hypothetical protein